MTRRAAELRTMSGPEHVRICGASEFEIVYRIINDSAEAYRGHVPAGCLGSPYMSKEELLHEMAQGVVFWGYQEGGTLMGVMGVQDVRDVSLIRHAYVRSNMRGLGIGSELLAFIMANTLRPTLVGTWRAAYWAVRFYEKHGFRPVPDEDNMRLLGTYWDIPHVQAVNSVVLADARWFECRKK